MHNLFIFRKKLGIWGLLACLLLPNLHCTKDFEAINTDPNASDATNPAYLFSTAILQGSMGRAAREGAELTQAACYMQYIATVAFNWNGDKYIYNGPHNDALFDETYKTSIKTSEEVLRLTSNANQNGLHAAAQIWRVLLYHRLTDAYGDVPYFEAGKGNTGGAFYPVYDAQEVIYADLMVQLQAACLILENEQNPIPGDILYFGDAQKWKKFGYSLMLRLASHCSSIAPDFAREWTEKAIQGGVMEGQDDSAILFHTNGPAAINENQTAEYMASQIGNPRICKTLADSLLLKKDPRIFAFAVSDTFPFKGLPAGSDEQSILWLTGADTLLESYSHINYDLFQKNTPTLFLPYAEVELLLAEAALRGWQTTETAQAHFQKGVEASLSQWNAFFNQNLDAAAMEDYYQNTLLSTDIDLTKNQVAYELWLTHFLNPLEAWTQWRRTGQPVLTPVNYAFGSSNGQIPRRFLYPNSEKSTNNAHVTEAAARMGGDAVGTRVWWDK